MIQAAMMFALGFSVCGLIALALYSALSRRTRRLAEDRVKRRFATKRQEFETERDEIRARHAVEMQRLEREVRTLGDEATAYRLDAAMKDIEINSLNSELDDREDAINDLSTRLEALHDEMREGDRKLAESGTALRAARHALQMQAHGSQGGHLAGAVPVNGSERRPEPPAGEDEATAEASDSPEGAASPAADTPDAKNIRKVADEIQRIADETEAEILQLPVSRSEKAAARKSEPGSPRPKDPSASPPPSSSSKKPASSTEESDDAEEAEDRIRDALEQFKGMKEPGGQSAAE